MRTNLTEYTSTHTPHKITWTHNFSWGQNSLEPAFQSAKCTKGATHPTTWEEGSTPWWASFLPAMCIHTSSGHRPDEQFSPVVLCLQSVWRLTLAIQENVLSLGYTVTHTTLAEAICHWITLAPARPMAVSNMYQRGYPWMTGGHDSVMSICLACHVHVHT